VTPAVVAARRAGVPHRLHSYETGPDAPSYALEASEKLGIDARRVLKTLIARADGALVVGIVSADRTLDLKALADSLGAKRAEMAPIAEAERATGYVVGGISPIGQRKRLPTVVDRDALDHETVFVSAGRRGLEIELDPEVLVTLCAARVAPIAR
jgi:Cys-tRNA(Pro)/Cys-tRNA(Cys) deacylase